jgi:hypothetical protein
MLYREMMVAFWDPHKTRNAVWGQNVELLYVKLEVHIVTIGLQKFKFLL